MPDALSICPYQRSDIQIRPGSVRGVTQLSGRGHNNQRPAGHLQRYPGPATAVTSCFRWEHSWGIALGMNLSWPDINAHNPFGELSKTLSKPQNPA